MTITSEWRNLPEPWVSIEPGEKSVWLPSLLVVLCGDDDDHHESDWQSVLWEGVMIIIFFKGVRHHSLTSGVKINDGQGWTMPSAGGYGVLAPCARCVGHAR